MEQLLASIKSGDLKSLKSGLQDVEDINALTKSGETLMTYAAKHGNTAVVDFLIESGASVMLTNKRGQLPSNIAMATGKGAVFARIKSAQAKGSKQNEPVGEVGLSATEIELVNQVKGVNWKSQDAFLSFTGRIDSGDANGIKEKLESGNFAKEMIKLVSRDYRLTHGSTGNPSEIGFLERKFGDLQVIYDLAKGIPIDLKNKKRYPGLDEYSLSWIAATMLTHSVSFKIADDILVAQHVTRVKDLQKIPDRYIVATLAQRPKELIRAFALETFYEKYLSVSPEQIQLYHEAGIYQLLGRSGKFPAEHVAMADTPGVKAAIKDVFDPDLAFETMSWAHDWGHPWKMIDQPCVFDRLISMGASMPSKEVVTNSLKHVLRNTDSFHHEEMERSMTWLIKHGADKHLKLEHKDGKDLSATEYVLLKGKTAAFKQFPTIRILQLKTLIKHGFEIDWNNAFGLLNRAEITDFADLLKLAPEGLDTRNSDGETPLMIAAREVNVHAVTMLLALGANPHLTDAHGKNALAIAAKRPARSSETKAAKERVAMLIANEMSPEEADSLHNAMMTRLRSLSGLKEGDRVVLAYANGDRREDLVIKVISNRAYLESGHYVSMCSPTSENRVGAFEVLKEGEEPLFVNKKPASLRM